jgi:hypothetical protein
MPVDGLVADGDEVECSVRMRGMNSILCVPCYLLSYCVPTITLYYTALRHKGKSGLDNQAISRVRYELKKAVPCLQMHTDVLPLASEFLIPIENLASQLCRMVLNVMLVFSLLVCLK